MMGIAIIQARPLEVTHKDVSGASLNPASASRGPSDRAGSAGRFDGIGSCAWTNARTRRHC